MEKQFEVYRDLVALQKEILAEEESIKNEEI
jgi:hypothetical protein